MEKLEIIIINEMMADHGPTTDQYQWIWGMSVRTIPERHRVIKTQTNNDMCYDDMCAIAWK